MCKAILFDLDGVLVDACDWHKVALNQSLDTHGYETISEYEHNTLYNGLPTKAKLQMLEIPEEKWQDICDTKTEYMKNRIDSLAPDLNKIYLFLKLKEEGYKVGCVTNCSAITAINMLENIGVFVDLDIFICNSDVDNPKPDPEGYLLAMERLGVLPENTYIFEDSLKGLKAARASGANVIEVQNATQVTWELVRSNL